MPRGVHGKCDRCNSPQRFTTSYKEKKHTNVTTNKATNRFYVSDTNKCPIKFQKGAFLLCGYLRKHEVARKAILGIV